MSHADASPELQAEIQSHLGKVVGPQLGWDPVNSPMIRHWCEALGDDNPIYTNEELAAKSRHKGIVAPPAMMQAWTMKGFREEVPEGSSGENPFQALTIMEKEGYTGVVAVNCEQEYNRYVRPGDKLKHICTVTEISEEKQTPLGAGFFVTVKYEFQDQWEETVGTMLFRVLKFRPAKRPDPVENKSDSSDAVPQTPLRPRPAINRDNAFFWEGTRQNKLLVQQCSSCGEMRHPPGAMCPDCRSLEWETVEMSGRGEIYSFVNLHHPAVPPFDSPNPIALVELEEGIRIVAGLIDIKPRDVKIGLSVEVVFEEDGDITVALFRPVAE